MAKSTKSVLFLTILALASIALIQRCTSSPSPLPTPVPTPFIIGYLWSPGQSSAFVYIVGSQHEAGPVDVAQMQLWAEQGEACVANRGDKAWLDHVAMWERIVIQVAAGPCRGFKGWVSPEYWQPAPP